MRPDLVTAVAVAVTFVIAGLVAVRLRPRNRVGVLMAGVGMLWVFAKLTGPPTGVRVVPAGAWAAVLAHLVVAFPTGRLGGLGPRLVVGTAYLSAGLVAVLEVTGSVPGGVVRVVATAGALVSGVGVVVWQVGRWRRGTVPGRRSAGPVLGAGVVAAALFVALKPAVIAGVDVRGFLPVMQAGLAAVPLAYLGTLLRRRIDRGRVAELVVHLRDDVRPMRETLARVLHDPALEVGYWSAQSSGYVDVEGRPVSPPPGDRVATRIDHDGAPLALLVHDPALLDDPELVEAACAAAGLALANERLTADLRARLRQLAESRGQVVRAAETERRRLERDLHDGVQQRLLSVPLTLGLAESALPARPDRAQALVAEAKATTLAVLAELRALSQGIHPPVLTERGLRGAVQELAALAPVPARLSLEIPAALPAEAETAAYYVVAEALANVTKHADAQEAFVSITAGGGRLLVEVRDDGRGGADPAAGSGLRGLAGRVGALGGTLHVDSPPGAGTRVRAVLPCG
ncbi:sensor histidine kinase [Sphaerisporangium sp. B11E5]|uniref:sensor histidine kinase n=1 Tax=Sphaerisporangium sp. B11E5 TaxID=3153563 RepID=UPI00325EE89B